MATRKPAALNTIELPDARVPQVVDCEPPRIKLHLLGKMLPSKVSRSSWASVLSGTHADPLPEELVLLAYPALQRQTAASVPADDVVVWPELQMPW